MPFAVNNGVEIASRPRRVISLDEQERARSTPHRGRGLDHAGHRVAAWSRAAPPGGRRPRYSKHRLLRGLSEGRATGTATVIQADSASSPAVPTWSTGRPAAHHHHADPGRPAVVDWRTPSGCPWQPGGGVDGRGGGDVAQAFRYELDDGRMVFGKTCGARPASSSRPRRTACDGSPSPAPSACPGARRVRRRRRWPTVPRAAGSTKGHPGTTEVELGRALAALHHAGGLRPRTADRPGAAACRTSRAGPVADFCNPAHGTARRLAGRAGAPRPGRHRGSSTSMPIASEVGGPPDHWRGCTATSGRQPHRRRRRPELAHRPPPTAATASSTWR